MEHLIKIDCIQCLHTPILMTEFIFYAQMELDSWLFVLSF